MGSKLLGFLKKNKGSSKVQEGDFLGEMLNENETRGMK